MSDMRTLAETLAIAVLREDMAAAYALADALVEQQNETQDGRAAAQAATRDHRTAVDGYEVYHWPEFRAFCQRLGVLWDLRTINVAIYMNQGEMVRIEQTYAGSDIPADPHVGGLISRAHIDTTTL